jgi:hypothetical protein
MKTEVCCLVFLMITIIVIIGMCRGALPQSASASTAAESLGNPMRVIRIAKNPRSNPMNTIHMNSEHLSAPKRVQKKMMLDPMKTLHMPIGLQ